MISACRALLLTVWLLLGVAMQAHAQSSAVIPPLTSPVVDTTGTLSRDETAQLQQQALALQQRKGSQLQILIVRTTRPEDIETYAQRVFDQWKLGREGVDDGVLLLVAKEDRQVRIQPGYGLEGAIPDVIAGRVIQEYLVPKFRTGDFAGGINDATAQLVRLIDGEPLPEPMAAVADEGGRSDPFGGLFLGFFIAIFAGTLVGALPLAARMLLVGLATGIAAGLFAASWWVILPAALMGAGIGAMISITVGDGRYAGRQGWGGFSSDTSSGDWSGSDRSSSGWSGSDSSSSSSDWSGGGGSSGGSGASGSW